VPEAWLGALKQVLTRKPLVLLRFSDDEWEGLDQAASGIRKFTIARPHHTLRGVSAPTACIFHGPAGGDSLCIGVLASRASVTTLDSRLKVQRGFRIAVETEAELPGLLASLQLTNSLITRLRGTDPVVVFTPALGAALIDGLARSEENHPALRMVAEVLGAPTRFRSVEAQQDDAIHAALTAFDIPLDEPAVSLDLVRGERSGLARMSVIEDSVIEHDARAIPGLDLVGSGVTGRAVFGRGPEQLEVFTANRRDLEHCFGVDLIYLNAIRRNLVMVQYKMLEPVRRGRGVSDWIYRPDGQLERELERMRIFNAGPAPEAGEYRFNSSIFYLKFVKRDGDMSDGSIMMPLEHLERLCDSSEARGPNGGVRVSYTSLGGRYLRQGAFLELVRAGYAGAYAATTDHLRTLIEAILGGDRALVAAIQRAPTRS
jgi:hypothetical protein